jgi:hypothetical protein
MACVAEVVGPYTVALEARLSDHHSFSATMEGEARAFLIGQAVWKKEPFAFRVQHFLEQVYCLLRPIVEWAWS